MQPRKKARYTYQHEWLPLGTSLENLSTSHPMPVIGSSAPLGVDNENAISRWLDEEEALISNDENKASSSMDALHQFRSFSTQPPAQPSAQHHRSPMTQSIAPLTQSIASSYQQQQQRQQRQLGSNGVQLRSPNEIGLPYRNVFKFKFFNAMQSSCFDQALYTDTNMVISAPTGSGKTALIELAMIRVLSSVKSEGKIIYMAPTKALCSQKAKEWSQKFKCLGATCKEYTGDTDFATVSAIKSSTIIVTTPEKWDSMTRRWKDHKQLMSLIKLFVIDEVHILNEDRGAVLEACVSRMKTMQHNIRFLAISATVPNVNDIAEWLQGEALTFSEEFRPVKLERIVYGFPFSGDNMFVFDKRLDWKLLEMIENHSNDKPVLIFCSTRKSAQGACETLCKLMDSKSIATLGSNAYRPDTVDVKDKKLKELFKRGIGYHHAGLDAKDRAAVEGQFTDRRIRVVATTSTLALGVNLPTYLVIIKSTKCYQNGSMVDYSDIELLQMIGRAGRPGMEDAGCAVIMTTAEKEERYKTIVDGTAPIESCLHLNLIEHLMSEICLGTISDNESQSKWLRSTFLHVRVQKNPNHYNIHNTSSIRGSAAAAAEEILQVIGQKCFDDLVETNLVGKRRNPGQASNSYNATAYGDAMDKYYIKYNTMKTIMASSSCSSVRDVLELVSHAEEFASMRFTTGEKPFLNSLQKNPNIRFPTTTGKVSSIADKIFLVIQCVFGDISLYNTSVGSNLAVSSVQILHQASRITKCIIDCSIHEKDAIKLKHALGLHQSLQAKMWPSSSYVTRQIDKIGKQMSTSLVKAGVTSFEHLRQLDAGRIELILHRNPPFGNQIKDAVDTLPMFDLVMQAIDSKNKAHNKRVTLQLDVSVSNSKTIPYRRFGKGCYAQVWTETDQHQLLDFRRISVQKLQEKSQRFYISTERCSQPTKITCYVQSEGYVGLDISRTLLIDGSTSEAPSNGVQMAMQPKDDQHVVTTENLIGVDVPFFDDISFDSDTWLNLSAGNTPPVSRENGDSTLTAAPGNSKNANNKVSDTATTTKGKEKARSSRRRKGKEPQECKHKCRNKETCKHSCCKFKVEPTIIQLDDTPIATPKPTQEELLYEWDSLMDDLSIALTPMLATTSIDIPQSSPQQPTTPWHSIPAEDPLSDHDEDWQQFIDEIMKEAENKASTEISTPANTIVLSDGPSLLDEGIDERVPVFNIEDQPQPRNPTRYAFWDSIGDYAYRTLNSQRNPDTTTRSINVSTSTSSLSRMVPLPTSAIGRMIASTTAKNDNTTHQQQQQASKQKSNRSNSIPTRRLDENATIVPSTQPD